MMLQNNTIKSVSAFAGIASAAFIATNLSYIRTTFLADSFSKRDITGTVYGAVEGSYGIGNLVWLLSGVTPYLIHTKKINLKRSYLVTFTLFVVLYVSNAWLMWIKNNTVFIALSILDGILAGCFTMCKALLLMEAAQTWLPHLHNTVSGVLLTFNYLGGSVSLVLGSYLYDRFGYQVPYYTSGGLALISLIYNAAFLPDTNTSIFHLGADIDDKSGIMPENSGDEQDEQQERVDELSPAVVLPAVTFALVTVVNGAITVTLTPYLKSCCNLSIAKGGKYLLVYTVSAAVGGVLGGFISKHETVDPLCVMIVGASVNIMGIGIMFPPGNSALYQYGTCLVYVSMMLCGVGEMMMSSVALKAMLKVQNGLFGRTISPQQNTIMSSIWFGAICVSLYIGRFLGGTVMNFTDYFTGGLIYMGICGLTNVINVALWLTHRIVCYKRSKYLSPTGVIN